MTGLSQSSRSPASPSQSQRRRVIRRKHIWYTYLPFIGTFHTLSIGSIRSTSSSMGSWLYGLRTGDCKCYESPHCWSYSHNLSPFLVLPADRALGRVNHSLAGRPPAEFCSRHLFISSFPHFLISYFLISHSWF